MYTRDGFLYQANYTTGLRVLDTADVANANLTEVAFFDTRPESDAAVFQGAWSVYPFFDSCSVIVSDIQRGLFVLQDSLAASEGLAVLRLVQLGSPRGHFWPSLHRWKRVLDSTLHRVEFRVRGRTVGAGLYFYRLRAGEPAWR